MVKRISCRVIDPASTKPRSNVTSITVPRSPRMRQFPMVIPETISSQIPVEQSPTGLYIDLLA
ncbi:MAG: hypothetical protein FVQ79_04605 [Planctomycetes bacterium]|nr:hypothetical protein [Planctomycetota bacterium]